MPAAPDGADGGRDAGAEADAGPADGDAGGTGAPTAEPDPGRGERGPLPESAFAAALAGLDARDLARFVAALHRARGAEATVETRDSGDGDAGAVDVPARVRVRPADAGTRTLLVPSSASRLRRRLRRLRASVGRASVPRPPDAGGDAAETVDAAVVPDGAAPPALDRVDVVDARDLYRACLYGVDRATFDRLVREHLDRPGLVRRSPAATDDGGTDGERSGERRTRRSRLAAVAVVVVAVVAAVVGAGAVPPGVADAGGDGPWVGFGGGVADGGEEGAADGPSPTRTAAGWSVVGSTATPTPTPAGWGVERRTATPTPSPTTSNAARARESTVQGCPAPPAAVHPAALRPAVGGTGLEGWRLARAANVTDYGGPSGESRTYDPELSHRARYVDPAGNAYHLGIDRWASPGEASVVAYAVVDDRYAALAWGRYTVAVDPGGREDGRSAAAAAASPSRTLLASVPAPDGGTLGRACAGRLLSRTSDDG
jgi:hypothetical protein